MSKKKKKKKIIAKITCGPLQATPPPPPAPGARRGAPHFVGVVASQCSDALINCKVSLFNFIATSRSLCNSHGPARWYCLEWRWWVVPSCFCGWPLSFSPIYSLQSSSPSPTKQTQVLSLPPSFSLTHTLPHRSASSARQLNVSRI